MLQNVNQSGHLTEVVIKADKHSITFHWPYCVKGQHDIDLLTVLFTAFFARLNFTLAQFVLFLV